MKKTYIIPAIDMMALQMESSLLADSGRSLSVNANEEVSTNFVKGDRSSREDYNVWSEDWSK